MTYKTYKGRIEWTTALSIAAIAVLAVSIIASASFYTLRVGEVGVIVDPVSSQISKPVMGPTIGFKAPWAYMIKDSYTVEVIELANEQASGKYVLPPPTVLTKDGVTVTVEIVVRYRIVPQRFDELVRRFPNTDYDDMVLVPKLRQLVRDVIAKVTLDDLIGERDQIAKQIEQQYKEAIENDSSLSGLIEVLDVNVMNFILPSEIVNAINQKVAAQQDALRAQYERQRIEELAWANYTRLVLAAMAEANATEIRAKAQAAQITIVANATKAALEMLIEAAGANSTESAKLAELYIFMNSLKEVAQTGNVQIVAISGGTSQAIPVIPITR